ncbi:hypothetical protein [Desulfovermiculus halophilus]|jgi:hypothetical protein|uniref:hypothetical protein n=1 Tax=Desulfovermiculus halophilus TaxID=339722 RepID=UPI000481A24F|nr:hypothetical protein [Desulfovermiculus halophilus]
MNEAQEDIWISVLGSGWHVIYEPGRDENGDPIWKYPLFMEIEEQDDGQPGIIFRPLCVFGNNSQLSPIDPQHIMYSYRPAEDVISMRDKFVQRYKAELESMKKSTHDVNAGNGGRLQ